MLLLLGVCIFLCSVTLQIKSYTFNVGVILYGISVLHTNTHKIKLLCLPLDVWNKMFKTSIGLPDTQPNLILHQSCDT